MLVLTALGVAYPLWWDHRSATVGHQLLQQALAPASLTTRASGGGPGCVTTTATRRHPGVLEIPAIGLQAPVLPGVNDAVLAVAVGHYPASPWPGADGESLLLAHDVSYFSALDHLHRGEEVIWATGCRQVLYRVVGHKVTHPGATISLPRGGAGLALITCWPTDALFWTPDRYVLQTVYVGERLVAPATARPPIAGSPLAVPAPSALWAQGLTLDRSGVLLGKLVITGSPSRTFRQSPAALTDTNLALEDYIAARKTAANRNHAWWTAIALPGVALPAPWAVGLPTDVSLTVTGDTVTGAVIRSAAAVVTLTVRRAALYVARVTPGG